MISMEKNTKNIVLIVLFGFLLMQSVMATIENYAYPLTISSSSFTPTIAYAGNEISIVLNLYNKAKSSNIENAVLKLSVSENFEAINNEIKIDSLQPEETTTIVFKVKAKDNAVQGTHVFTIFIAYDVVNENRREKVKDTATVSVTLQGIYALEVKEIKASNSRPYISEKFTISALIENNSASEAKNVKAELSIDDSTSFSGFVIVNGTQKRITSIKGKSKEEIIFTLIPAKDIAVGTYTFKLDLSCENCSVPSSEKIAIEVLGKPNIIVSAIDYSIEGRDTKNLMQADLFSMSLQLDNIGEEKAKAVKVTLDTDEDIIGTKESFIGNIEPDDSGSAIFDLKVAENAKEGYHEAIIRIEYLDELDRKQSFTVSHKLFIEKRPPESPIAMLVLILAILVVLYFIIKMVLRQLAIKKLE